MEHAAHRLPDDGLPWLLMTDPVKAKIIELVPDIMDIDDGARVLLQESFQTEVDEFEDQEGIIFCGGYNKYHILSRLQYPLGTVRAHKSEPYTQEEIEAFGEYFLGRPITLADVLRATRVTASTDGSLRERELLAMFDLTADYDGQDQPTKDFIGKQIGVTT